MWQIVLLIIFVPTLYAIIAGITYAVLKKLEMPEGVKEPFALFFPVGIPFLVFGFIAYCTYKLMYKLFKWK